MQQYPINLLHDRARSGLEIRHTDDPGFRQQIEQLDAHRDDNCLFILVEQGEGALLLDFVEYTLTAGMLLCILPGQVHHRIRLGAACRAWALAIEPALLPVLYRPLFDNPLRPAGGCLLEPVLYQSCQALAQLLAANQAGAPAAAFQLPVARSLIEAFVGLTARSVSQQSNVAVSASRPGQLAQAFRQRLAGQVQAEKRPAAYAAQLCVSEAYLNEVVKSVTGFTVTHWVLHEVLLQAKRQLFYTELTVKEIAQQLGYEDPTYFSRLFKKVTQLTPLEFRKDCRK